MKEFKEITYTEPAEYFPKELRKKYGLGEFADEYDKREAEKKAKEKSKKKDK